MDKIIKMIVCVYVWLIGYANFLCADKIQGAKPWLNGWQYAELF